MRRPILAAAVAFSLCLLSLAASAQDDKPKVDPKTDNYGDPLPPGALLRLGTTRLQGDRLSRFAWMPDGKSLVTASQDRICFWSIEDGRELWSIPGPMRSIGGITPDGSKIIGRSAEDRLVIFDLNSAEVVSPFGKVESYEIRALAMAPDGTKFATGRPRGAVRIWDVTSGEPLVSLTIDEESWREIALAYSPDSRHLAVGAGRTIRLFDLEDAADPAIIENAHGGQTTSLAFTPDGKRLVSAGTSDFETRITPDGRRVGTDFCEVFVWDVAERKRLGALEFPERMQGACVMALAPDGDTLVTMHGGKSFVWDVAERKIVRTLEGIDSTNSRGAMIAAIDPTGKRLAASLHETHVRVYDLATGERVFTEHRRHTRLVTPAAWSHDGRWIATGSTDGAVQVWDATSGKQVQEMKRGTNWVRGLAFTADNKALLVGATDIEFAGALNKYNVADGELVYQLPLADPVTTVTVSHDGEQIAVATGTGPFHPGEAAPTLVHLFAVSSGKRLAVLEGSEGRIKSLCWSADDSAVIAAEDTNVVRRFDVASGRELSKVETPHEREMVRASLNCAAFLGDDTVVLTNGVFTNQVHAWDLATGESMWTLDANTDFIRDMAASPDGRIVANYGIRSFPPSTSISIWDTAMRRQLWQVDLQQERVYSMAFSPDGKKLVTGLGDGTALVWDVSPAWERLEGKDQGR
jgi:WD40 repeat protein